jgi:hypothetical protein
MSGFLQVFQLIGTVEEKYWKFSGEFEIGMIGKVSG